MSSQWSDSSEDSCPNIRQNTRKAQKCHDPKTECCKSSSCKPDKRPPFAKTMPEDRRLAILITNDNPDCGKADKTVVMGHLFKIIEAGNTPVLNFSECVPMAEYGDYLVVVCQDEVTLNWLTCAINMMCEPHSAFRFINFFELIPATTVVPATEHREDSCSIFEFLERQNKGLLTHKWVLMKRYCLDPCAGSEFVPVQEVFINEVLELYIDEESKCLIQSTCSKLKYQFWTIEFTFEC